MPEKNISRRIAFGALATVMLGVFMSSMDQTVVGTAMPRIIDELGGMSLYSWVFTAYMLASTIFIPIFGKMSDIFGRKYFYMGGMLTFMAFSWIAGLSQNIYWLIGARAFQGIGAAALMAVGPAIIGDVFTPRERGKYQGLIGAVFAVSSIIGPLIGGYLTDRISWHWVFYVNMPIGIPALVMAYFFLSKELGGNSKAKVDYWGSILLGGMIFSLLMGLSYASIDNSWIEPQVWGLFIISAMLFVPFYFVERKIQEPILELKLFKNQVFTVANSMNFLVGFSLFSLSVYIPLFVQGVQGQSATNSGLILMPVMLASMASSVLGGFYISRAGKYKLVFIAGSILTTIGLFLISRITYDVPILKLDTYMILAGFGVGVTMGMMMVVIQSAVDRKYTGLALSSVQFFRSIGGTVGTAVFGTIVNTTYTSQLTGIPKILDYMLPKDLLSSMNSPQFLMNKNQILSKTPVTIHAILNGVFNDMAKYLANSITYAFLIAAIASIGLIVLSIAIKRIKIIEDTQKSTAKTKLARRKAISED
ncbi:MDR family MFS transporter [Athalassotoga saccharophila]|uniref:MDR family MFS transporter n=1 Tax=Athalassotoga saccharophila TaxID=1441386 RepID=UPI001379CC41|nr:MDR family MFS transporter [Athalassotoga saccharophila]BBJ28481.1 multidrug resistance protein 3 [Athalassotoga saccharophila]